jgi:hypothetical protein
MKKLIKRSCYIPEQILKARSFYIFLIEGGGHVLVKQRKSNLPLFLQINHFVLFEGS